MGKTRVLIVEDQFLLAEDLAGILEESGYEVIDIVDTGEEAVQTALTVSPDLVMLDIRLRGAMDGIEAARLIRTHLDPAIVYLTAHSEQRLFDRAKETKPDGYLYKPVSPIELTRTVEIVLFRKEMERRLRESEAKYKELVETVSDGIVQTDRDGTVTFANPAYCRMLGFTMEEMIGKSIPDFQPSELEREEMRAYLDHAARRQPPLSSWFGTHRTGDGGLIFVQSDWNYRRNDKGDVIGFIAVVKDVTDRKKAEEELRDSEEKYRLIFSGEKDAILLSDAETMTIIDANEAAEKLWGGTKAEFLGMSVPSLSAEPEKTETALAGVVHSGAYEVSERRLKKKDGTEFIAEVSVSPFTLKNRLVVCSIIRDITERKNAGDALRRREEEFRRIIENLQDAFYRADMNGVFTFLSPASERVAGYKPEEGVGRPISMFYADPSERQEFMRLMMLDGFVNDFEAGLLHKDGHKVWVSTSARFFRNKDGNIAGVEGIARDISERKKMEQELRDREALLRSISDNLPSGMIYQLVRKPDGSRKFTYLSEQVKDFYGCSSAEAENDPQLIYGRVLPADRDRVFSEEEKANENLADFQSEVRMISPSGDIRWSHFASSPRRMEDGSTSWSGLEIDITERKKMEESLQESETKYRLMFEFSPFGVFHFDDTGTITACNDKFVEIIGSSRERLIGLNTLKDLKDTNIIASIRHALSGGIGHYEDTYTSVTGQKATPVRCEFAPILTKEGAALGGIGIVQDISERKRAEEALRKSEHLYRSVIENIEDVFYRSDAEGRLLMSSPSGARVLGYDSVEEMIGVPLDSFWVDPKERDKLLRIVNSQGKVTDFEGVLKRRGGSPFTASLSTHFYRDEDGKVLGTEGIVRDISDRKRMEANLLQSQKMQAMGTLAGGVAHEINNLLQVVLGNADMLLLREGMDEKSGRSLEAIRRAAGNGANLVKGILTFSRKALPEMKPTNLTEEVRRLEDLLGRTIPRMISIEMSVQEDLWAISADPSQIEQILVNLAINAGDAMPEGGRLVFETRNVTIRSDYCRTYPDVNPGKYVLLTVSDTGTGMDKQTLNRVFEPFFTTKPPGKGTGLGLSVVFGVVKTHGAHITAYSELGAGTTFKIYFPVLEKELQPGVITTMEMPAGGTETVLLVDDDDAVRILGAEMLEMAGYNVLTASNGREALEIYRSTGHSISLVVLDLIMPEMSGGKCLAELLKINPHVKVLIASGYAADGPAKEARESGAAGFVSKPFDIKEMLLAVRKCLGAYRDTA
ncbi:MAG: PAS domain S-box protein [Pseudomonadota bacterium]